MEQDLLFDVVIIDGVYRGDCAKVALDKVNREDGYIIILDNSDWYPNTKQKLLYQDLICFDFHWFGPINSYTWTTSLFFSRNFKLNFSNKSQYSISSIPQIAEDDI